MTKKPYLLLVPAALALALAACGKEEKTELTTGQKDLIVEDPASASVPVNLPDTPMTNTPDAAAATGEAAPAKAQ